MNDEEKNGPRNGFIKLSRRLTEWEWADDPSMLAVWVHCLLSANWKDYRYHGQTIPRGSFLTSCRAFAERCGLSESTIRRCFDKLESTGEIQRQVTHRGTLVKVHNYAAFQDSENGERRTLDRTNDRTADRTGEQQEKKRRSKERKNNRERVEKEKTTTQDQNEQRTAPTLENIISFVNSEGLNIDSDRFFMYYERKNWQGVTDWKARAKAWSRRERKKTVEELPAYYNAEPIRDPDPIPATPQEIEETRKKLQRGKI